MKYLHFSLWDNCIHNIKRQVFTILTIGLIDSRVSDDYLAVKMTEAYGNYLSIYLWLYSPLSGLGHTFSFLIFLHADNGGRVV
jgi:hypothetical protein